MIKGEESYLFESYDKLVKFKQGKKNTEFIKALCSFSFTPIQNAYLKKDLEFLHEVNFILSIITSIVSKPFLNNTSNEIIVRSGQAGSLSNDDFNKTLKDPSFWKRTKEGMIPERVFYREYIDEIKTYENYFVVQTINTISKYIDNYQASYTRLINNLASGLTTSSVDLDELIVLIDKIERKLKSIKGTYFYKVINKDHKVITSIVATNILLDNQLYNAVFKFYKNVTIFGDNNTINHTLAIYYFCLLIKEIITRGLKYNGEDTMFDFSNKLSFENKNLEMGICLLNNNHLAIDLLNKEIDHLEKIDIIIEHNLHELNTTDEFFKQFDSVNFLSIWNYGYLIDNKMVIVNTNPVSEEKMIEGIIISYYLKQKGSKIIYSKYCPICKKQEIVFNEDNNIYTCLACHSEYMMKDDNLIFIKVREHYE